MCLTTPFQIKKINQDSAELFDGRLVNIGLLGKLKSGDWILANADLAVAKISAKEAKEIKEYFNCKK